MSGAVCTRTYGEPPFNVEMAMRFAGCRTSDEDVRNLVMSCAQQALPELSYRVCYRVFPITVREDGVTFPFGSVDSHSLADHLQGCGPAVLFGATVGLGLDRLLFRVGHTSPARGVCLQAIGAERIEALCDCFEADVRGEYGSIRSRFSPGYGDLSLDFQNDLFRVLDCQRTIGLVLNESMLMSPSKSVTAIIGVE